MKSKVDFRILGVIILTILGQAYFSSPVYAMFSAHPAQIYERGVKFLDSYHGNPADLYEAKECFVELMDRFPDSPYGYLGMSRVQKINAYLYGNRYNMNKVRDEVLPFAIKALEMGPSIREVHENYSALEHIYEDFYTNQKEAQDALLSFPDRAETYFLIGMFFGDQGEPEKGVEFYTTALGMEPSDNLRLKILERLGILSLKLEESEKSLDYFQQAMEIKPDMPILNENLGMAYFRMKNYAHAVDRLTKAVKSLDNSYTQYQLLQAKAALAEQEGKSEEAIKLLEVALLKDSFNIALHFKLGNLYYNLASYEKAYEHFTKVINVEPQNSGAYYFAGRSAYSLGKTDRAIDYYKRYLQLNADSEEAAWIRKNVPELSQIK